MIPHFLFLPTALDGDVGYFDFSTSGLLSQVVAKYKGISVSPRRGIVDKVCGFLVEISLVRTFYCLKWLRLILLGVFQELNVVQLNYGLY